MTTQREHLNDLCLFGEVKKRDGLLYWEYKNRFLDTEELMKVCLEDAAIIEQEGYILAFPEINEHRIWFKL
jgi:hypothetical protein